MKTWGIDWATEPGNRGAVCLGWTDGSVEVLDVRKGAREMKDDQVISLLLSREAASVAVDVPFGWPDGFRCFLEEHARGPAHGLTRGDTRTWRTQHLGWRETDRCVARIDGVTPFRVSFDRLGATAVSWGAIEAGLAYEGFEIDRSGMRGTVVETYPSAVRAMLKSSGQSVADGEVDDLLETLPAEHVSNPHVRDALVCAVAARAHALGLTGRPGEDLVERARVEGWIHVPRPGITLSSLEAES